MADIKERETHKLTFRKWLKSHKSALEVFLDHDCSTDFCCMCINFWARYHDSLLTKEDLDELILVSKDELREALKDVQIATPIDTIMSECEDESTLPPDSLFASMYD